MAGPATSSQILAYWRYTPEEWKKFAAYEGRHWHRLVKQSRTGFFIFLLLTVAALLTVPVLGLAGVVPWDRFMLAAVLLILLFGGGIIGFIAVIWLMQRSKLATLNAGPAEVSITSTAINIAGASNNWNFGDSLGNRFYDARTMKLEEGKPNYMELLEVRTIAYTLGNPTRDVITSIRVPIPSGKWDEAERIVGHLIAEKGRA